MGLNSKTVERERRRSRAVSYTHLLLCGRFTTEVETVLVALDPLPDVIAEAVELGAQCIVTHHPLFFDPPRAINETTLAGRSVLELIEHGIAAVNLHTNLDCAPGGVNDALAAKLELDNVRVLNLSLIHI